MANEQAKKPEAAQEPAWLQQVPEQYREEARQGWLRQQDYTKKTTELADERKQLEAWKQQAQAAQQWQQWYEQQFTPWYQQVMAHQEGAPALSSNRPSAGTVPSGSDEGGLLTEAERRGLLEYVADNLLKDQRLAQTIGQVVEAVFQKREPIWKNYVDLGRNLVGLKFKYGHDWDEQKVLQTMLDRGIQDVDLGYQLTYGEELKKREIEKAVEEAKAQWEVEQQNRGIVPEGGGLSPSRYMPPAEPTNPEEVREQVLQTIAKKYGPHAI